MKTLNFNQKISPALLLAIMVGLTLTSCGSYQNSSYYDRDGIYGSNERRTYSREYASNTNDKSDEYRNFFASRIPANDTVQTFTDVDKYNSYGSNQQANQNSTSGNTSWAGTAANNVTINVFDNGWGWNNGFGWGGGWNNWGWGGGWHNGWNNWGGGWNNGYNNNVAFSNGRRTDNGTYSYNNGNRMSQNRRTDGDNGGGRGRQYIQTNRSDVGVQPRSLESTRRYDSSGSTRRNNDFSSPSRSTDNQPNREYSPSRGNSQQPSRSYTPSRSESQPSRSYTPQPSRSYTPSSSGGNYGGGGGSYGGGSGGGRSGGGGGGRRG